MGNKICFHPRVVLTEDIALHFKSSHLTRDVMPIIAKWQKEGSELCFSLYDFEQTFDIVNESERQFRVFDTDANGRVDAHEILMVYILLASGEMQKKIDTVFTTFDFAGSRGSGGTISFDEAMIMIDACVKGVQKVCNMDFKIPDDEIFFYCKSMFDMHRVDHAGRITQKQFTEWVGADASPRAFVNLFHNAQGLPDIYAEVQKTNLEQARVFQILANGKLNVTQNALMESPGFQRVCSNAEPDEMQVLVGLMTHESPDGTISMDRYHAVLRPWNIFNECDLDKSGTLDEKEMEILLWIQMRKRPTTEFVKEFVGFIDSDGNGDINRKEWVQAITDSYLVKQLGAKLGNPAPKLEAGRRITKTDRLQRSSTIDRPESGSSKGVAAR